MGKGARIRKMRKEKINRKHTLVTKQVNPLLMNSPANAIKAKALGK